MNRKQATAVFSCVGLAMLAGCQSGGMSAKMKITAQHNPTMIGGRGEPSLEDHMRPAAWIFVDGKPGEFQERNGSQVVGWHIPENVSPSPTFQLAVYKPLLGEKIGVNILLVKGDEDSETSPEIEPNNTFFYGLGGVEQGVATQKSFNLLSPGNDFVIRDLRKPERPIVDKIDPLTPGHYTLAASITNLETGQHTLSVTYFNVGT